MAIRFKCSHCHKPLAVKDELAGKRASCPACKKPLVIPAPIAPPADIEAMAAAALADEPVKEDKPAEFVEFDCPMCGDPVKLGLELAGKNAQCPACKNIVKVPLPKADKPKDWRDMGKKGPAAALINLPEQLDDAWGTELKGRVSREAMEEAGALPEVAKAPVGIGGWIRRGVYVVGVLGVVSLIVVAAQRNRQIKSEKDVIVQARELDKELAKDPKKRLPQVLKAEIERADGELQLRQGKGKKGLELLGTARALIDHADAAAAVEQDLFLIELARSQFELGGEEDQIRAKARYDWDVEVLKEVMRTIDKIKSPEAKVIAIRELGSDLIARKRVTLAIRCATSVNNSIKVDKGMASPALAQLTALVEVHGDAKKFNNLPKPPDMAKLGPLDLTTRMAYAEGFARKANFGDAMKLIEQGGGTDAEKVLAAIGVACVAVADKNCKEAAPFVAKALSLQGKVKLAPWYTLQLCRAAYRCPEHAAAAKELADKMPPHFKRQAKLEWLMAQLEKSDAKAAELVKELPEDGGSIRAQAWIALGRHFGSELVLPEPESEDGPYIVFAKIGRALGPKEPAK